MKFNFLKVNGFGKLVKKELELSPKINIIYGENEAGKSSLLKFLTAMLYGASKNKNKKSIPDFEKYKPWKTEEFSGSLEYTLDNGETFEVYREFKKKNPSVYNSEKEDISKTFKENKTKGIAFFEEQTGIDEETYLNTAIIEQEEIKLEQNSQNAIIQKISNKVSSGDDSISYKKTITQINKLQGEKVGTDRTQNKPINIVSLEIRKVESKRKELEELKESIVSSEKEYQIFKEQVEKQEKINTEEISKLSENLKIKPEEKMKSKKPIMQYIILAVLAIISILLFLFVPNKIFAVIALIITVAQGIAIFIRYKKNLKTQEAIESKKQEELIKSITEEIKSKEKDIEKMKRKLYEIEFCQKSDKEKLEELPLIVEKLDNLYDEQEELTKLNNSYNIAKECLERAYEEVKKNISPKFTNNLCEVISKISDGKYNVVKVSDEEGLIVQIDNGNYVPAERLSVGTIDQMYLSLRLSSLKEISKENMPIILDEAFAYFDDKRLSNILEYLSTEYKDSQILIFTCSSREEEALKALNISYNRVDIN